MYKDLINEKVIVVISSRGDVLLEYIGTLISEDNDTIILSNAEIRSLILNFQRGLFGEDINKFKEGLEKVIINKKYIISCNK